MRQFDPEDIGYYGKPITALSKNELLAAFADFARLVHESVVEDKKIEELVYFNLSDKDKK